MKVVVAIDSLKGSLTSMEAGRAIRDGVLKVLPDTEVVVKPLADGGEGTTEALAEGLGGEMVYVDVHGPLETPVKAGYGWIRETKTAIMEMAAAAGIIIIGKDKRPLEATTYGVGEMMKDA
ncbi:MAG: glycerate kinase, partial [Lachnospiraceae bacterium]|nr:glycerate kinase [Lachnospiraceae bacterium]